MKFSYRIIAVLLVCVVAFPLYFLWKNNDTSSIKKIHLMQSHIWPISVTHHPVIQFHEECKFAEESKTKADIDTFNILSDINDKLKSQIAKHANEKPKLKQLLQNPNSKPTLPPKNHNETLTAIIVPHSHNDPGWINTLDGYFNEQTKPTLNNMIEKLKKYPKMTFIWAESVFLSLWWAELSEKDKRYVKELVKSKQLEIVVGSWVVPDEANPHYFAIIDQMIEGHQWLEGTLGVKPKNTWALDPFGYSSTLPYLYQKAGFENMVVLRVHHEVKDHLERNRSLEFYWRQHWDSKGDTDIQTLMMPYMLYNIKHTCGPHTYTCLEFDFRQIDGENSESRAVPITDLNVEEKARKLIDQYRKKSSLYKHNVVLIPLGDDFRYDRNIEWDQQYKNYMKLFKYINSTPDLNAQARFGTVQDYFDEVEKQMKHIKGGINENKLPTLSGDFFPYTDKDEDFWTGYFTTRPFHKKMGRELEHHLRAADIVSSIANAIAAKVGMPFEDFDENLKLMTTARRNLGLFQHHDAITGTARDFVASSYLQGLADGLAGVQHVIQSSLKQIVGSHPNKVTLLNSRALQYLKPQMDRDAQPLNVEVGGTDLLLFNPTTQERNELVRVYVSTEFVEIKNSKGETIPCQVNPVFKRSDGSLDTGAELIFYATVLPLGVTRYTLYNRRGQIPKENYPANINYFNKPEIKIPPNRRYRVGKRTNHVIHLENNVLLATFSPRLGTLRHVKMKQSNKTFSANTQMLMYSSRGSGAYIFYPEGQADDSEFSHKPLVRVIKGPLVEEIHVIQKYVEHRMIVGKTSGPEQHTLEIENFVDIHNTKDKELIMRLNTNVSHPEKVFYTDLNGFHIMRRKTFSHYPLQANYYPMTSMAYIDNGASRVTLFSNQPVGVASLHKGSLEVMLDRRLSYDDGRGLGEGIYDNVPVFSQFKLLFESRDKPIHKPGVSQVSFPSLQSHSISNNMYHPLLSLTLKQSRAELLKEPFSPLKQAFPCDIMLLNLRQHNSLHQVGPPKSVMILHHQGFDCSFPASGFKCQTTDGRMILHSLFSSIKITSVDEMTLSLMHKKKTLSPSDTISMKPMQLGTYLLTFQSSKP